MYKSFSRGGGVSRAELSGEKKVSRFRGSAPTGCSGARIIPHAGFALRRPFSCQSLAAELRNPHLGKTAALAKARTLRKGAARRDEQRMAEKYIS